MSRTVPLLSTAFAALAVVVLTTVAVVQHWSILPQNRVGGNFIMTDADGRSVTEADFLGKPTAFTFGYTHCPDVCPTTLLVLSNAMAKLGQAATKMNVLFVTVDPARDTVPTMHEYLGSFDPRIRGLTGTESQVAAMARAYHVFFKRVAQQDGEYLMDHSAGVMLFDATGRFQAAVGYDDEEDLVAKLRTLLGLGTCLPDQSSPAKPVDRPASSCSDT